MNLLDKIREYLKHYYEKHVLFMFDASELCAYNEIPNLVDRTNGHSFWDIILDENSFEFVLTGLDSVSNRDRRTKIITYRLCNLILQKVGINTDNYLDAHELESYVVDLCQNAGAISLRVHVMLNEVVDIDLQKSINDLMLNSSLTFFCYSTHKPLTLNTSDGEELTYTRDFKLLCSDVFSNNNDNFERKMKK